MSNPFAPSSHRLTSCHILEQQEETRDVIWAWSYPLITPQKRLAYTSKFRTLAKELKDSKFQFFHYDDEWGYAHLVNAKDIEKDSNLCSAFLLLTSSEFHPARYHSLCRVLADSYSSSMDDPHVVLRSYLSVLSSGKCTGIDNEAYYFHEFHGYDFFRNPKLSDTIATFGHDVILIYTSLLLKHRILVYHHEASKLSDFILNLPAFITHRSDIWDSVYPLIENTETELAGFAKKKFYIVGCSDDHLSSRTDFYDLYINVPAAEVMVAPHARGNLYNLKFCKDLLESLTMTKTHKDVAVFVVQLVQKRTLTERDIMQEIGRKTKELIENLKSFGDEDLNSQVLLSMEKLKSKEFSPSLESFLLNLAQAENLVISS